MSEQWTAHDEAELRHATALKNALTEDIATYGPAGDNQARLLAVRKRVDELEARKPKPVIFYDDDMPGDR